MTQRSDFRYSSFVRIGSGLSFADYVWVRDKPWKVWDPKAPPSFFQTARKAYDDKGDVYLEPEQYGLFILLSHSRIYLLSDRSSFILKVKAAEIVPSGVSIALLRLATLD
jgi:DNA ligase 4